VELLPPVKAVSKKKKKKKTAAVARKKTTCYGKDDSENPQAGATGGVTGLNRIQKNTTTIQNEENS
jgi:hypothetical protein